MSYIPHSNTPQAGDSVITENGVENVIGYREGRIIYVNGYAHHDEESSEDAKLFHKIDASSPIAMWVKKGHHVKFRVVMGPQTSSHVLGIARGLSLPDARQRFLWSFGKTLSGGSAKMNMYPAIAKNQIAKLAGVNEYSNNLITLILVGYAD